MIYLLFSNSFYHLHAALSNAHNHLHVLLMRTNSLFLIYLFLYLFIYLGLPILARGTATVRGTTVRVLPPLRERPPHQELHRSPNPYKQWVGSLTPRRIYICKDCEMGPMVYRPYPRRLESLKLFADVFTKAALSSQLFKDPECWAIWGFNQQPPTQQTGAYPIELTGQQLIIKRLK